MMDVCEEINKEHGEEEKVSHAKDFIAPAPEERRSKRQTKIGSSVCITLCPAKY